MSMASSVVMEGEVWGGRSRISGRQSGAFGADGVFRRSSSTSIFAGENVFSRSASRREEEDEEALRWAALEKLPTYDRVRTAILNRVEENGSVMVAHQDVTKLGLADRLALVDKVFKATQEDNERFLHKMRERLDKVGIELPTIQVRFEHLNITAGVHVSGRALPTLLNFTLNFAEGILGLIGLAPTKKRKLNILQDISGIVKPSRMTLLLGPPNAGKTTLLLALAGKLDTDLKVSGRVSYNGHELHEFVPQRTAAYISQNDLQDGEMTVRETLDFYGRCQGVGTRYDMLVELSRREKEAGIKPEADLDAFMKAAAVEGQETSVVTDYVLKVLGLDICADTVVGDEMRRGISGGQRKRVTTGEMLVGPARALFMDEISTGLDSATTFQIVKFLRQSVHFFKGTMLVSLLQPAPETYELFDDLILLSEGQIVYQGPRDLVLDFFETVGFKCPDRKGVADFLQEVTSKKDQEQYWNETRAYNYVSVNDFAAAFLKFHVGERIVEELGEAYDKKKSHPAALVKQKYALSKYELFKACFSREWLLTQRNSFIFVFKFVQITMVATVTMTVFFRTEMHRRDENDASKFMGALFFALINVMFNGLAEMAMTIKRLPVFYKQRDVYLYPAWAFTLPTWVLRIPMSLMESGVWIILTYYVVGFTPEASRFFRQFLLLFLVHQMSLGLFRLIAAIGRTLIVANTGGSFALLVVFVLGGFIVSRNDIHPWWIWGYWISPLTYGQNAIAVNEFLSPRWQEKLSSTGERLGTRILESRGIFAEASWFWIGIFVLIGYNLLFNVLSTWALAYFNPLGKPQAIISEEELDEKQANLTGVEVPSREISLQTRKSTSTPHGTGAHMSIRRSSISSTVSDEFDAIAEAPTKGMVLPFPPLAIAFHNLNYHVDMPSEMKQEGIGGDRLQLLHNVSGAFRPGVLTALVGVSGAGKTTLMDVLAGRKTGGYTEGSISISGYPKNQQTFARVAGYCEQNDIHSPYVTVYESLLYSAWLRLSADIDADTRMMFVEQVMDLVELNALRDGLVGLPGVNGLSTEQRKRLTIAVELVANPSIIFMDEPTSGLDARAAAIVMRTVRNTVDTGRTVVCTIHQPSIDIFEAFDELLLMKRGGRVIYAGALGNKSEKLVEYFQAVEGVPRIKEGYNPATWMLEVTAVSQESRLNVDFAQIYTASSLYERNEELIKQVSSPGDGTKDLHFDTQYAQAFSTQCAASLWKQHKSYWRNPQYNVIRLFFTFVCAILFGTIFWNLGPKRNSFQDLFNVMGSMYAAVLFIGVNNAGSVQPVVGVERTVFYRERAAGMYSALAYAFGQVVIELPYVLVQALIYGVIVYSMMNLEWTAIKFLWFIFFMYFTFLYFTLYGMMTVSLTPNHQIAAIVSAAFYGIWNLFAGFLIPRPQLPVWWRWYYWATPVAWSLYGLITSQLGDLGDCNSSPPNCAGTACTFTGRNCITTGTNTVQSVKALLEDYLGLHHDFLPVVAAVHVGLVVLFAFVFASSIKYLNFQRR